MSSALISFILCYLFLIIFFTKSPRLSLRSQLTALSFSTSAVIGSHVIGPWFLT